MLEITTLYNGMILYALSLSSHDFDFGFPIKTPTNEDSIPYL